MRGFAIETKTDVIEGVEDLAEAIESVDRPRESEPEDYDEVRVEESGPYWDVSRLFEDL